MSGARFGGMRFDLGVRLLSRGDDQGQDTKSRNNMSKSFDAHGNLHLK
jgi:hypothetical protein